VELRKVYVALQNISRFSLRKISDRLSSMSTNMEHAVDLAVKLNVLALFAVFAFVGAILLGAF
jgi:hypothetical protein